MCTVTGHGLKDPKTAMKDLPEPKVLNADKKDILKLIGFDESFNNLRTNMGPY